MSNINRGRMIYVILAIIFAWYALALAATKWLGLDTVTALGIGTVGGVLVAKFSDAWQFVWRTSSPKEKAEAITPNTTTTTTTGTTNTTSELPQ